MDNSELVSNCILLVKSYAKSRASDVARGAESPRLAALLVQKFGLGVSSTATLLLRDSYKEGLRFLGEAIDREVEAIDPLWRENAKIRWKGNPADIIAFGQELGGLTEVKFEGTVPIKIDSNGADPIE